MRPFTLHFFTCGLRLKLNMVHRMQRRTHACVQAQEVCEGGDLKNVIGRASMGVGKRHYSYGDAHRWSVQVRCSAHLCVSIARLRQIPARRYYAERRL